MYTCELKGHRCGSVKSKISFVLVGYNNFFLAPHGALGFRFHFQSVTTASHIVTLESMSASDSEQHMSFVSDPAYTF